MCLCKYFVWKIFNLRRIILVLLLVEILGYLFNFFKLFLLNFICFYLVNLEGVDFWEVIIYIINNDINIKI